MTNGPFPKYQIETWTAAVKDYTITSDCLSYRFKTAMTDQLGNFTFSLPAMKGTTKCYDDIALFDKVYFYAGYNSVGATALFAGRIESIQNQWAKDQYVRTFSGHDLGEVTTRLLWHQNNSDSHTAHEIVDHWRINCGLADGLVDADATVVEIISSESNYQSLLKTVSDYSGIITKDWYVDVDNKLVWKARPLRSGANVSILTVGDNILSYNLTRDLSEVYNNIYGFGASEPTKPGTLVSGETCTNELDIAATDIPTDHKALEETLTDWTYDSNDDAAVLAQYNPGHPNTQKGIDFRVVAMTGLADEWMWVSRAISPCIRVKDSARLNYFFQYAAAPAVLTDFEVRLLAPDTSNYFFMNVPAADWPVDGATGKHLHPDLGPAYESSAADNTWIRIGSPSWYDIEGLTFYMQWDNDADIPFATWFDAIYFSSLRWHDYDADIGSTIAYGVRDLVVTDDRLHSNTEVSKYLLMLKAKHKDPFLQLDVVTPMDVNLLVGDQLQVTIPNENLPATKFDVIRVEHTMDSNGFFTKPTMISQGAMATAALIRSPSKATNPEGIMRDLKERHLNGVNSQWATWR